MTLPAPTQQGAPATPQTTYTDSDVEGLLNDYWLDDHMFSDGDQAGMALIAWSSLLTKNGLRKGWQTNNFAGIVAAGSCVSAADPDVCSGSCVTLQDKERCVVMYATPKEGIEDWQRLVAETPSLLAALNAHSTRRLAYEILASGVGGWKMSHTIDATMLDQGEMFFDKKIAELFAAANAGAPQSHLTNQWLDKTWREPGATTVTPPTPAEAGDSRMSTGTKVVIAGGTLAGLWAVWKYLL